MYVFMILKIEINCHVEISQMHNLTQIFSTSNLIVAIRNLEQSQWKRNCETFLQVFLSFLVEILHMENYPYDYWFVITLIKLKHCIDKTEFW